MIIGGLGLALNILTIAFLSFSLTLLLMSILIVQFNRHLASFNAKSRSSLLWCVVGLPWLVALFSVVVLVFPVLLDWNRNSLASVLHWHHIYSFPVFSWHGAALLLFCSMAFILLFAKLIKALKNSANLSQLNHFIESRALPNGCLVLESESINAFASGLITPQAYITSGLMQRLENEENAVVQQHELAHVAAAHPLKKYAFSLFSAFFPIQLIGKINDSMALAYEQIADEAVQKSIDDVALVSRTIIKVTRLQGAVISGHQEPAVNCSFSGNALELRILYLLDEDKGNSFPYFFVCFSALTLAAVSTLSVDYLHHFFEQLFSH